MSAIILISIFAMTNPQNPTTRAESSGFTKTSTFADVQAFIEAIRQIRPATQVETFASTMEGRGTPLVILAKERQLTPESARKSGKPIVFILANIHAGEVEGKEASLQILRDLATGERARLMEKLIVLIAPIYNADGNEQFSAKNRTAQNGPAEVGIRENLGRVTSDGQIIKEHYDLNRDYMKLETLEAQGLTRNVFNRWDPDLLIDLHTTNGSYHGYHLTYSPPLNPNTDPGITAFLRNDLLPAVTTELQDKFGYRIYHYGNFANGPNPFEERGTPADSAERAWMTFDHRPRFGTNCYGLRNRLAILSEAYSYLDFKTRIDVTYRFVNSILDYAATHGTQIRQLVRHADLATAGSGIRFEPLASPKPVEILVGSVTRHPDPTTGRNQLSADPTFKPLAMKEYIGFSATRAVELPEAYVFPAGLTEVAELARRHGIRVDQLKSEQSFRVDRCIVESVEKAARPFQGHRETKVTGRREVIEMKMPAGSFYVSMKQPRAPLIFYLLDPESDDGAVNWNLLDSSIAVGKDIPLYPVVSGNGGYKGSASGSARNVKQHTEHEE